MLLAAAFGDWRDTGIFLKLRGACVALPLFTRQQAVRAAGCAGLERALKAVVRPGLLTVLISTSARDGVESHAQLFDERLN
jgi:hypothetical protein